MSRIRPLSDVVSRRISTMNVIQDVESVVKELLENSIDAGATSVSCLLEDGGCQTICITDNGCGVGCEDLVRPLMR